jgi:glucokinase
MSERVFIGADVGATTIAAGLVAESGDVLLVTREATHARGLGAGVITLVEVVEELVRKARHDGMALAGIGVGLAGVVDAEKGMMIKSKNHVPEFAEVPLAAELGASTGLPVFVENDANALALGEITFGVGRGVASMALLALGTGVGGAIVVGGALERGNSGVAGEFGHVSIDFRDSRGGSTCGCGIPGCLNSYVSGQSLAMVARERVQRGERSVLMDRTGGDLEKITAKLVFETAAAGDGLASAIVERGCDALGVGIGVIVNSLDPELIVITGGVASSLVPLRDRILETTRRFSLPHAFARTRVEVVPSDKRRTVLGGAALALSELARDRRG